MAVLIAAAGARAADAGPLDLAGGCATAHAALHGGGNRLDADRLEVSLPAQPDAALHAAHLSASAQNAVLPPGALAQASTAAAAAILVAATGHHGGACSNQAFEQAVAPLAHAIAAGGHASFTWTALSIRSGDKRLGAGRLALRLEGGDGGKARLFLSIDGAVSNDPAASLLPGSLGLAASLPGDQLPALLAAAGGHGAPVDLTIDRLDAKRGPTTLQGSGQARIASAQSENAGTAHVTVDGFDALVDAAGTAGLEKLRTGLFLAKLMAHRHGDAADWDLAWQGGTLLVNNVPLPLR